MSGFGDPAPQHRNALAAVDEARQRALKAVSQLRQSEAQDHHPNLAPADGDGPTPASMCTQAAADYLLQLRPYRSKSDSWGVNMGSIELPTELSRDSDRRRGYTQSPLLICREPVVPLRNVSDLINAANMKVQYSTKRRHDPAKTGVSGMESSSDFLIRTSRHGDIAARDESTFQAVVSGAVTPEEALESGTAVPADNTHASAQHGENQTQIPGDPNINSFPGDTPGPDQEVRTYNLVFPAGTLLRFVELADEVAAELDLLADLKQPDYEAGGGDAA